MAQQIVNLTVLSLETGRAKDTLKTLMYKNPDFPVISRGTHGRGYQFDLAIVTTWLNERERKLQAEAAQRRVMLARSYRELSPA